MKKIIGLSSLFISFALFGQDRDLSFKVPCEVSNNSTVAIAGDVLIHKALYKSVLKAGHFDSLWQRLLPLINKADFSVANLEGPTALGIDYNGKDRGDVGFVYDDFIYSGTNFVFNYHPLLLSDLKKAGLDLMTSANNHSTDRFSLGIDRTLEASRAAQLPLVGTRHSNGTEEDFYKIMTVKKMKIAFLGCTEYINIPDKDGQVLFCEDPKIFKIIQAISQRPDVDALIVMPHWGVEYSQSPRTYQREYAQRYLEAGASVVAGSHPHVLQPWEKYVTRKGRETLIVYSLGNFIAAQDTIERQTGAMVYIGFTKKSNNEKAQIYGVGYTPTIRADLSIIPLEKNANAEAQKIVSTMFGTKRRLSTEGRLSDTSCVSR